MTAVEIPKIQGLLESHGNTHRVKYMSVTLAQSPTCGEGKEAVMSPRARIIKPIAQIMPMMNPMIKYRVFSSISILCLQFLKSGISCPIDYGPDGMLGDPQFLCHLTSEKSVPVVKYPLCLILCDLGP